MNVMRKIKIEKLTLNIGCAADKEKMQRAEKLLLKISDQKPMVTLSHKRSTFGITKRKPMGYKVTMRGKKAEEFLTDVLDAIDKKVKLNQINGGNFSIGVKEYIDLQKIQYDPEIGIIGFDVAVTLERPGYRVKRKKIGNSEIGKSHIINKEETLDWLKNLGVSVVE